MRLGQVKSEIMYFFLIMSLVALFFTLLGWPYIIKYKFVVNFVFIMSF
jgi:hypothetical protein